MRLMCGWVRKIVSAVCELLNLAARGRQTRQDFFRPYVIVWYLEVSDR